jgi:hypothetical protein
MTRRESLTASCALALWWGLTLPGCFLTSMEPFYERGETLYDPALLGSWARKNCSEDADVKDKYCTMAITPHLQEEDGKQDRGYRIAFRDEHGIESEFDGFVFELDGVRFLDTCIFEGPHVDVAFAVHALTGHVLAGRSGYRAPSSR